MIIAWGLLLYFGCFFILLTFFNKTVVKIRKGEDVEIERFTQLISFLISLCSAQYIWG